LKRGTLTHPKTLHLADELNLELWGAAGVLETLWHFAQTHARRGDIGRHSDAAIARAIGWRGDAALLIKALVSVRWLDECACHRLRIHDWPQHADQAVYRTEEIKRHGFIACYADASGVQSYAGIIPEVFQPAGSVTGSGSVTGTKAGTETGAVQAVFRHWQQTMGHESAVLTPKREKLIRARLQDSTRDELVRAIDGCRASPFHMGENDGRQRYDDIALICRDRDHVERFMRFTAAGPRPAPQRTRDEEPSREEQMRLARIEDIKAGREPGAAA